VNVIFFYLLFFDGSAIVRNGTASFRPPLADPLEALTMNIHSPSGPGTSLRASAVG
jgi:hypothetical protein